MCDKTQEFNLILQSFGIKAKCVNFVTNSNYSYYDLILEPKTKMSAIERFNDEISLAIKANNKATIKPLYDKGIIRFEFCSDNSKKLLLFDLLNNKRVKGYVSCLLGESTDKSKIWMDLAQNPHMIVSGSTGSGKSTLLHNIIANIFHYNECNLYLIDPKAVEFQIYENYKGIKFDTSYKGAICILDQLLSIMEYRYSIIKNSATLDYMPYSVLIIDEFSDLIMQDKGNEFYNKLCLLSQKCRAARISIILSTQRPSANIINGTIKANFPARIACKVASHVDSKVVIDAVGAEKLNGYGDALLRDNTRYMERFQIAYTTPEEIHKNLGHKFN
jgi:S-DNA-T family DNA segregation ATPase FtsK/SpoIIIE